jgi:hypothetical protein
MIFQQWAAILAVCSQLQLVKRVLPHGAVYFRARVFLYDTYDKKQNKSAKCLLRRNYMV